MNQNIINHTDNPVHVFLKNSGADVIPKGNQLKQYLPYGVINVVRRADCLESFICQKPALTSSLENMVDSLICARICSTNGKICFSLHTLMFSFVKSTQMRMLLLGLGTTTIPAHQSVGSSTLVITPMFSEFSLHLR